MTINETHRLQFYFISLWYVFFTINHHHNLTTTTATIIENIVIIISLHCTVPECFAVPSSSLVVQPKLQHSMLQTYSLHPSLMRHHTARCKDKIIPNSLHKKQANKQVNNIIALMQFNEFSVQSDIRNAHSHHSSTGRASLPHGLMMIKELPSVLLKF